MGSKYVYVAYKTHAGSRKSDPDYRCRKPVQGVAYPHAGYWGRCGQCESFKLARYLKYHFCLEDFEFDSISSFIHVFGVLNLNLRLAKIFVTFCSEKKSLVFV